MKRTPFFILILLGFMHNTYAQKLPNIQQVSVKAPANVKIDGKSIEWGKFEAYNNATSLHYTMANDDANLYLAIQASDPNVLTKITHRGVLLFINTSGKKTDKDAVSINYPVFELKYNNKPFIRFSNASGLTPDQRQAMTANPDSVLKVMNKRLHDNDKFIRTNGMSDVDTLLSIYNEKDIVAKESFDIGPVYTYEIAIPLKYLKLPALSNKFAYHIVLKGMSVDNDLGLAGRMRPDGKMEFSMAPGAVTIQNKDMPAVVSTTDFWGEYVLAK